MITRERDAHDERALIVALTSAGAALRAEAELIPPAVVERLGVDYADLEELRDVLTRVDEAARRPLGDRTKSGKTSGTEGVTV